MFNKITGSAKNEAAEASNALESKNKTSKPNLKESSSSNVEEYVPEGLSAQVTPESPKEEPKQEVSTPEIKNHLSKDVSIKGKLKLKGDIAIDGNIEGEILTEGLLLIKENATIKASIDAGSVIIYGKVEGNIKASEKIELFETASVQGDLQSLKLKVDSGAVISGRTIIGSATKGTTASSGATQKSSNNRSSHKTNNRSRNGS